MYAAEESRQLDYIIRSKSVFQQHLHAFFSTDTVGEVTLSGCAGHHRQNVHLCSVSLCFRASFCKASHLDVMRSIYMYCHCGPKVQMRDMQTCTLLLQRAVRPIRTRIFCRVIVRDGLLRNGRRQGRTRHELRATAVLARRLRR